MNYRIHMPVCSPANIVKDRIKELAPVIKQLILVNNWIDPLTLTYCQEAASMGAEVYHCPWNMGACGAWNFATKKAILEDGCDFIIIMSPSAVIDKDIRLFIDEIISWEKADPNYNATYVYGPLGYHMWARTRKGIETDGWYDENYWPVYTEDADYLYRCFAREREAITLDPTYRTRHHSLYGVEGMAHSLPQGMSVNTVQSLGNLHSWNHGRNSSRYLSKWGGCHGSEKFVHPFNNPSLGLNDWTIEEGKPFMHNCINGIYTEGHPTITAFNYTEQREKYPPIRL